MTSFKMKKRIQTSGFTLTELAIVLGIIGVILSAVWFAASNASELQKENNAVSEMQSIVQNMDNILSGQNFNALGNMTDITNNMIKSQAIPSSFVDVKNLQTVDNPWSLGSTTGSSYTGLIVWGYSQSNVTYRISFYDTTYKGCMALLLQGTSCQSGQQGCPIEVWTGGTGKSKPTSSCVPGLQTCPGSSLSSQPPGWQSMGVNVASTMCAVNPTNGGSVEFDYSL